MIASPATRALAAAGLLMAAGSGSVRAAAQPLEELHYRWRIEGPSGLVMRLLPGFPAAGHSVLRTERIRPGVVRYVFTSTAPGAPAGNHWTYSSEVDLATRSTVRVVDRLLFRKRDRTRTYEVGREGAVDLLHGLHRLRSELPRSARRTTIWSNRSLYAAVVEPEGFVQGTAGGSPRLLRKISIRGVREPGLRPWKGSAELWLEPQAPFVPVEIVFSRSFGRVRLRLVDEAGAGEGALRLGSEGPDQRQEEDHHHQQQKRQR